jgi:hypothetical protein
VNLIRGKAAHHGRGLAMAAAVVTLSLAATGCSGTVDDLGYTPTTLAVDKAKAKTGSVSSQILNMIGIKGGKVTEPGPGVSPCDEDPEHLYLTRHPWSVYEVSQDELKKGFQRLREALPKNGWKIVDYGPNKSKEKTLEMTADYKKERFSVNAELWVDNLPDVKQKTPLILINVVSGCFRAPAGTKLDQEF